MDGWVGLEERMGWRSILRRGLKVKSGVDDGVDGDAKFVLSL